MVTVIKITFDEFKHVFILILHVKGFVKYTLCKKIIRIYYSISLWHVIPYVVWQTKLIYII